MRDEEVLFKELAAEMEAEPLPPLAIAPEDWIAFALFWLLAGVVFLQFFTRYVLNDSLAWTEEIARYLLMAVTFLGAPMAARKGTHIAVEFLAFALPPSARRILRAAVGAITVAFFAVATWLCWQVSVIMETQYMVVIDWPLAIVFYLCCAGLALTTLRAAQASVARLREAKDDAGARP